MAQWEEHRIAKHNWPEWPGFKSHSGHSGVQDKNQGGFTDYFYFKIKKNKSSPTTPSTRNPAIFVETSTPPGPQLTLDTI